jgi:cytochrome o ubiquinol oxidase subunit IV
MSQQSVARDPQDAGRGGPHGTEASHRRHGDAAPGEQHNDGTEIAKGIYSYLIGLGLAALLTVGSFWLSSTGVVYGPGVALALIVFAIAQMGIHLVFFLHLTTGPDNINNAMALALGVLIVLLLIGGSTWIMYHMNHNMVPMSPAAMSPSMNMQP